ncbi:MAG: hypothetical protein SCH70_14380 [Candidatus Methanoperedens sp.]|nr:hypothetical protein [Candidatus Methanoperedens sp.]
MFYNAVIQRAGKIRVTGLSIESLRSRAALTRAEPGAEKRYDSI